MGIVYTKTSSGKKRLDARAKRKLDEHRAYVASLLIRCPRGEINRFDEPKGYVRRPALPALSNAIGGVGHKRSIDDHRWKKDAAEPAHVVKEIEAKKKQVAPAYSKGAYQFILSPADVKTLGRKV